MTTHHSALAIALLALVGLSAGCGKHPATHQAVPAAAGPAVQVQTRPVAGEKQPMFEEVVGTVRARTRASLEAKVPGRIERINATLGQAVKRGDVLVELNSAEVRARVEKATAVLEQAERDLKRFQTLLQQQAVTQAEFDALQAKQRVAKASLEEGQTQLGYMKLVAPFDAVVTRKMADVGDLAVPGRGLLELEDPASLQFEADVPEALIHRLKSGDRLNVFTAPGEQPIPGTVSEIAPSADSLSRTFRVKLDLASGGAVRPGQFGRVAVPIGEAATMRVPGSAVVVRGQLEMVFVVTNQVAQLRLVKTGKKDGENVEILSGLMAGEKVVVQNASTLLDGQPVL